MTTQFNERLGQKGYTMVARAPESGVARLADGSWHVMGGSSPANPDRMHEIDRELIPFILSKGGDVVLYRLPANGDGAPQPVLSRGGMAGRPPLLNHVHPYDEALVRELVELRDSAEPTPKAAPAPRKPTDRRPAACVAAALALLLGGGAYWNHRASAPASHGATSWVPDMSNPRDAAIARGAMVLVAPRAGDPDILEVYRVYPKELGGGRDYVDAFQRRDYERSNGYVPESPVAWRKE